MMKFIPLVVLEANEMVKLSRQTNTPTVAFIDRMEFHYEVLLYKMFFEKFLCGHVTLDRSPVTTAVTALNSEAKQCSIKHSPKGGVFISRGSVHGCGSRERMR
jgi:hypothetical protein